MKAPHGKKGPKPLQKGSGTLFGGVFAGFLALDASKKVFEHFLIDILWCLNILNNISKIEKNHTVPLRIKQRSFFHRSGKLLKKTDERINGL